MDPQIQWLNLIRDVFSLGSSLVLVFLLDWRKGVFYQMLSLLVFHMWIPNLPGCPQIQQIEGGGEQWMIALVRSLELVL